MTTTIIVHDIWGPWYTNTPGADMQETHHEWMRAIRENIDDVIRYAKDSRPGIKIPQDPFSDVPFQCISEEWLVPNGKLQVFPNIAAVDAVVEAKKYGIETVLFTSGTEHACRDISLPKVFEAYNRERGTNLDLSIVKRLISLHGTGRTKKDAVTWHWFLGKMSETFAGPVQIRSYFDDNFSHLAQAMSQTGTEGYYTIRQGTPLIIDPNYKLAIGDMDNLVPRFIESLRKEYGKAPVSR